ncbi:MAG TPA: ABC transporter ATP-binding protein [Advenella sp.]|nr:ABC transporter ATP-binding protein [Advenella sp.]
MTPNSQSNTAWHVAAPAAQQDTIPPVLDIADLHIEFPIYRGAVRALNGVTIRVQQGEIVGVVGESGSGKSVTAMMSMRLIPQHSYVVRKGSIHKSGKNILAASEKQMRQIRGSDMAMIFQEPMTALNPTMRVGRQITDVVSTHTALSPKQARERAISLLREMHIADPEQVFDAYPFELSGGMRQRIMIALAFSCEPSLLIADEPTTALDVTVQKQVLMLLRERAKKTGTAILLITHDMAVVSQFCERIYVMYAGSVVEQGAAADVINRPAHPYTRGLLGALPENARPGAPLLAISGQVPNLADLPAGCAFRNRCRLQGDACSRVPPLLPLTSAADAPGHAAACWMTVREQHDA